MYPVIFTLFVHENICCRYSLEAPRRGASNEYPQHMYSRRNKKYQYFSIEKKKGFEKLFFSGYFIKVLHLY